MVVSTRVHVHGTAVSCAATICHSPLRFSHVSVSSILRLAPGLVHYHTQSRHYPQRSAPSPSPNDTHAHCVSCPFEALRLCRNVCRLVPCLGNRRQKASPRLVDSYHPTQPFASTLAFFGSSSASVADTSNDTPPKAMPALRLLVLPVIAPIA